LKDPIHLADYMLMLLWNSGTQEMLTRHNDTSDAHQIQYNECCGIIMGDLLVPNPSQVWPSVDIGRRHV